MRGAADERGRQAACDTRTRRQPGTLSVAGNRHDNTQQFGLVHRLVPRGNTVSLCHEAPAFMRNHTMREQPVIAGEHRDVAGSGLRDETPSNCELIPRPH